MARGRKLTMSQSERYLGSGYSYGDSNGNSVTDESELTEEDIWSHTVDHSQDTQEEPLGAWSPRDVVVTNGRVSGLSLAIADTPSSTRIVHQIRGGGEGGEGGGGGGEVKRQLASSAPVNVPDWSKIYRVNSVESIHESEEEDEEEEGMMPPHEYLAKSQRRRSRNSGGGASVFEGVGRTLKGRELRRVRDAIWSKTGFYG